MDLVGPPETVAAQRDEAMQEASGDGFLLVLPNVSGKRVAEVMDGLVRRGHAHRQFSGQFVGIWRGGARPPADIARKRREIAFDFVIKLAWHHANPRSDDNPPRFMSGET